MAVVPLLRCVVAKKSLPLLEGRRIVVATLKSQMSILARRVYSRVSSQRVISEVVF